MRVSIGILSYNRPELLIRAVKSVVNQTYQDLDIHISDNGSNSENMNDVLKSIEGMDKRIRVSCHLKNCGPLFNFRYLLDNAIGEYFLYLADDDYFTSDYIETCIDGFAKHPAAVLSAAMPVILNENNKLTSVKIKFLPQTQYLNNIQKQKLLINYSFYDDNFFFYGLFKTDVIKKSTIFLDYVTYAFDMFLLMQVIEYGDICINTEKQGLVYTRHDTQTSSSLKRYKEIFTTGSKRHSHYFFFTKALFIYYYFILKSKKIKAFEKIVCCLYYTKVFILSKRYIVLKYDLGLDKVGFQLKRWISKIKISFKK